MKRAWLLWALLSWGMSASYSQGQQAELVIGVPVEGQLAVGQTQVYRFNAVAGSVLSFSASSPDGALDPVLNLASEQGEPGLSSDDAALQRGTEAIIEGFTVPFTGTYRLTLSGFGSTSGVFLLRSGYGYLNVAQVDNFSGAVTWSAQPYGEPVPQINHFDSALSLSVEGIAAQTVAWATPTTLRDFYAGITIREVTRRNAWATGLALRADSRTVVVEVSEAGLWRAAALADDGQKDILRDWTSHPAIVAGATSFRLDVLAYDGALDVFYERQYVGTVLGAFERQVDRLGVYIETANAFNSAVQARFDDYQVSLPTLANGERLSLPQLYEGRSEYIIRSLQRAGQIPSGGALTLNLPEASGQFAQPGISRVALARGQRFADFVLGAQVVLPTGQRLAACGLALREQSDTDYALAYVDSLGGIGWSYRQGDAFPQNLFFESAPRERASLLVIALGGRATLYVNGLRQGSLENLPTEGALSGAVVNYEGGETVCGFRDIWLWSW